MEKKLYKKIKPTDKVLDLGAWDKPFQRANFVVDLMPYNTRGFHTNKIKVEYFSEKTWIQMDFSNEKLPFKDKEFDFVICSHVLEDIKDPIFLCKEMQRVSKAGYIEVPSMKLELTKGIEHKKYPGFYHHRWLVNIKKNKLEFRFKPHFIMKSWKFHFPYKHYKDFSNNEKVQYLFWENKFSIEEIIQISRDEQESFIQNYIKSYHTYKEIYYKIDNLLNIIHNFYLKSLKKIDKKVHIHKIMKCKDIIKRY
jgi:ubiquinone/menaquinone biosynthesis C-methylase UbiE